MSNVLHRVVTTDVAASPDELVDVRIYDKAEAATFVKAFEPVLKNHVDKRAQLRFVGEWGLMWKKMSFSSD